MFVADLVPHDFMDKGSVSFLHDLGFIDSKVLCWRHR